MSGSSLIVSEVTIALTMDWVVSTSGASPVTSTVCDTEPTCNWKSTSACRPIVRTMPLRTSVWNPSCETETL